MKQIAAPPEAAFRPSPKGHFVQTDRASHEAWARLAMRRPAASAVLHYLAANVGQANAVVISQKALAEALGVTDRTIRTAVKDLAAGNWVQVVKLGAGRECAYVLNDRVVWADRRDNLRFSMFSAVVLADATDQDPETLEGPDLRHLPAMFEDETQLPSGPGLPPASQPFLPEMEPDLPATRAERGTGSGTAD